MTAQFLAQAHVERGFVLDVLHGHSHDRDSTPHELEVAVSVRHVPALRGVVRAVHLDDHRTSISKHDQVREPRVPCRRRTPGIGAMAIVFSAAMLSWMRRRAA